MSLSPLADTVVKSSVCLVCEGSGRIYATCPDCHGAGHEVCEICQNEDVRCGSCTFGTADCGGCDGHGFSYNDDGDEEACNECGQTGVESCWECDGTGYLSCIDCNDGADLPECAPCGGVGKRNLQCPAGWFACAAESE